MFECFVIVFDVFIINYKYELLVIYCINADKEYTEDRWIPHYFVEIGVK
jgi:hypothetical protein